MQLDTSLDAARQLYTNYCLKKESQEDLDELRAGFKDCQVLGDDDFIANIRITYKQEVKSPVSLSAILEAACMIFGVEISLLSSPSQSRRISLVRGAVAAHALENGVTLREIARVFGRDESTISRLRSRFLEKHQLFNDLKCQVYLLKEKTCQLTNLQA